MLRGKFLTLLAVAGAYMLGSYMERKRRENSCGEAAAEDLSDDDLWDTDDLPCGYDCTYDDECPCNEIPDDCCPDESTGPWAEEPKDSGAPVTPKETAPADDDLSASIPISGITEDGGIDITADRS